MPQTDLMMVLQKSAIARDPTAPTYIRLLAFNYTIFDGSLLYDYVILISMAVPSGIVCGNAYHQQSQKIKGPRTATNIATTKQ